MSEDNNFWSKLMGDDEHAASYMETYGEGPGAQTRIEVFAFVNDGETVLDVGCGPGWNLDHFMQFGPKVSNYKGLDYSERFVRVANQRAMQIAHTSSGPFEVGDVRDISQPDGSWDVVIMQDVLEHTNGYAYLKSSCDLCKRGNNGSMEAWNVSKKTAQNPEPHTKPTSEKFTKEINATGIIGNNAATEEENQIDILIKMDTSKSPSPKEEEENTELSWNKNSVENLNDGKASTISTESEMIIDQKTSNSGLVESDMDREQKTSTALTASNPIYCDKHGPVREALRVASKRAIFTFWHLSDMDDPKTNDDGDDGWGAWYDKRQWEKFLDTVDFHWLHHRFEFPTGRVRDLYVIDKEAKHGK